MKKTTLPAIALIACLCAAAGTQGGEILHFKTGSTQTVLLQLFASQGCSSCPAAESLLNTFTADKGLWKTIVPVALHVDYWDSPAWRDPFASRQHSLLQQRYRQQGVIDSLYTPCFVVNGKEWKGWRTQQDLRVRKAAAGVITGTLQAGMLDISYSENSGPLELHAAVLGFGLETAVTGGENRGRRLAEDFVALAYKKFTSPNGQWRVVLPQPEGRTAGKRAIALWISRTDDASPLQAAGAWLPAGAGNRP